MSYNVIKTSSGQSQKQAPGSDLEEIHPPITSAEEQWLASVRSTSAALPPSSSQVSCPYTPSVTKPASVYFKDGPVTPQTGGMTLQTPSQQEAQRRMELMQQEVDEVIGVMRMNFDNKCVVQPDRRLSELYHLGPDYDPNWKCPSKQQDDLEKWQRRKRNCYYCLLVFAALLFILVLFIVDYYTSFHFLIHESETELKEMKEKSEAELNMSRIKSQSDMEKGSEEIKVKLSLSLTSSPTTTSAEEDEDNFSTTEETKPRGHDVLEPGYSESLSGQDYSSEESEEGEEQTPSEEKGKSLSPPPGEEDYDTDALLASNTDFEDEEGDNDNVNSYYYVNKLDRFSN